MTFKPGTANTSFKDGRRTGHRLGWITKDMHSRIVAQLAEGQTLSDWVIAAIEAALVDDKES